MLTECCEDFGSCLGSMVGVEEVDSVSASSSSKDGSILLVFGAGFLAIDDLAMMKGLNC